MVRQSLTIFRSLLPYDLIPLVGVVARFDFRQSTTNAFARIRFL